MSSSNAEPEMPPLDPAVAAAVAATADTISGVPGGNRSRRKCSVTDCTKQSQGARNKQMCRLHFKEWMAAHPDQAKDFQKKSLAAATMVGMGAAGERLKMDGGGQRRTLCKKDGCPKQSQGGRCNYMCAAHYNEEIKANNGGVIPSIGADGKLSTDGAGAGAGTGKAKAAAATGAAKAKAATSAATSGSKRKSHHPLCKVEGCPKQSQGGRCNHMCAAHYKEELKQNGGEVKCVRVPTASSSTTAAAGAGGSSGERPRKVRRNPNGGHHPLCSVADCPKQSQGSRCNFMCQAHFKESVTAADSATAEAVAEAVAVAEASL